MIDFADNSPVSSVLNKSKHVGKFSLAEFGLDSYHSHIVSHAAGRYLISGIMRTGLIIIVIQCLYRYCNEAVTFGKREKTATADIIVFFIS